MSAQERNWRLVVACDGKRVEAVDLEKEVTRIGRDESNDLFLPDTSVSRQHAEIRRDADGVRVRDTKSHNGIKVNGVPRLEATLQAGDRMEIGCFTVELGPAGTTEAALLSLQEAVESAANTDLTIDEAIHLPESRQERFLTALYHVCFWVSEGVEENSLEPRCLRLVLAALRAQEIQLYSADLELESFAAENGTKPSIKLAPFLARRFQDSAEAQILAGRDIAQHQQRIGQFNYLVGPLRPRLGAAATEVPFLVLSRPADWQDFCAEDRVLVQAICQLWSRGRVKAEKIRELRQENAYLRQKASSLLLLGSSPVMERLRAQIAKVAGLHRTVLLQGETGSGKEVVAQLLHESSPKTGAGLS